MPRKLTVSRPGLVLPVAIDPSGREGPTKAQARGPHWRRTSRGLYVPASADGASPEQRIVEAAGALPQVGGVTGWAGLRWAGGYWFEGRTGDGADIRPVPLAVGFHDIRPQVGIEVTQEHLDLQEMAVVDGLPMTTVQRSLGYEMRYAGSVRSAAIAFCMAAYSDLASIEEMNAFFARHAGWDGIRLARSAMALAEENCWSPQEVRMLLVWLLDAGLPRPLCNRPVFDRSGRHIGTPDLLDPEAGVAGEYDGPLHLHSGQRRKDRDREEAFRGVGLEYFTILTGDLGDRSRTAQRMRQARSRARFEAESRRAWTIELPPWWIPTFTVEQRRALTPGQQARVLGYRRSA
jgi:hypothetical protein